MSTKSVLGIQCNKHLKCTVKTVSSLYFFKEIRNITHFNANIIEYFMTTIDSNLLDSGVTTQVLMILPVLRAWNHCPPPSPSQTWLSVEASPSLGYSSPG